MVVCNLYRLGGYKNCPILKPFLVCSPLFTNLNYFVQSESLRCESQTFISVQHFQYVSLCCADSFSTNLPDIE